MLCRVEMPTNEQIYGRFYRYRLMHGGSNSGSGGKMSVLFLPILAVAAAVLLYFSGFGLLPSAVLVVAGVGFLAFQLYIKPAQIFRKQPGAAMQTEVTIFTETGFTHSLRSEEGGPPDNTSAQYTTLFGAVETAKDFYLFTAPAHAFLIDKEYFTKGTPEELRETLQKKLGKKFRGKK